ncbi:MAG: glycosyltransferase [Deltaproteobacteria bacterium]|nr:glycosyltransferase [Deltaproteobacteria bacterium]MBW1874207.1 glycosyltransferase [Deltaproteobacteria bacterium]MBW2210236.1 glycosyltransferase [Deltaproteobacteria bacterium]MBW2214107.1 glycosyltransferase [Deltaproteobacteria bacterium]MBW2378537.1 glycosyltransferase [Deltaproteobacteria bacterium]
MVQTLVIVLYLVTLGVLALYGVHRSALLFLYLRHRHERSAPRSRFDEEDLPMVTIQLPMFNEMFVAERLIEAAARIDYPRHRLEIQVLDDSTDATSTIARLRCDALRAEGLDVVYLHRDDRAGYKAGALEAGMARAKGDFLLVFDADFVPGPSIVRDLIDFFEDPSVGMAQARWAHLNRGHSLLTQCEAMLLDGHFVIEHAARNRSGRFFNFNGTAGMWRKSAIIAAGGWQHDTITEDMDLSYRAQLAGWKFVYAPHVSAPAELPCEMNSFKGQQYRWAKGSVQTARKLLGRIVRAPIGRKVKIEAFFHLTNNLAYLFLLVLAALQLPNMLIRRQMEHPELLMLDVPLFLATCGSIAAFYVVAHHDLYGGYWQAIRRLPIMMAVGIGLSINNGRAAIEGLFGRDVEFVRTPKRGAVDTKPGSRTFGYRGRWPWHNTIELAFAVYCTATLVVAIVTKSWASVPFVLLFCGGFTYVGLTSLYEALRLRLAQGDSEPTSQAPSTHSSPSPQSMLS